MRDCLGLARSALLVLAFAGVADALFGENPLPYAGAC